MQDDAEFAECVRKAEHQRGKNAGPGQRQMMASDRCAPDPRETAEAVDQAASSDSKMQ